MSAAVRRADLARARGLAEAIAQAGPGPIDIDGMRGVATEIVTLIAGASESTPPAPTTWEAFLGGFATAALARAPDPALVNVRDPEHVEALAGLFAEWLSEHRKHLEEIAK